MSVKVCKLEPQYITTPVDAPFVVTTKDVTSPVSKAATTSLDRTPRFSPDRQHSIPPIGKIFDETVSFEEVIASTGEVFPSELATPPRERETAPGEETAPEETAPGGTAPEEETAFGEETALGEETTSGEETTPGEETAPEEKIPDTELPYLDSSKWGSHNRTKLVQENFWISLEGECQSAKSSLSTTAMISRTE